MSDSISNLINKIQNGGKAGKENVYAPFSNLTASILEVLVKNGFIQSFTKKGRKTAKLAEVNLAYDGKTPKLKGAVRISKPSRRFYIGWKDIKPVRNGYGKLIISTSKGIITGEEARRRRLGGEPLFEVW